MIDWRQGTIKKHKKKKIKKTRRKGKNPPVWADEIQNEILKALISTALYFGLYFSYDGVFGFGKNILIDLSILIVINVFAVAASYPIAYLILTQLLFRNYTKRGFWSMNSIGKKFLYIIVAVFINSLLGAAMVLSLIFQLSTDWIMFLGLWIGYKMIVGLFSYAIAKQLEGNALLLGAMLLMILIILTIGIKMFEELNLE